MVEAHLPRPVACANMVAEVSPLLRVMVGYCDEKKMGRESGGEKSKLVTRDLLGGSSILADSRELDLDLQVPNGWEKMLDLKSGKVYVQRCQDQKPGSNQTVPKHENLNLPSSPSKITLNLFEENCLDLKLVSSSSSPSNYTSVCTLDKVKSALERAEKESIKKRWKSSSSPSYSSSSSSSVKELQEDENEERVLWSPIAAACPTCLSYVLIMKSNPRCPRCNSVIQLPAWKKPRIDLNMSV